MVKIDILNWVFLVLHYQVEGQQQLRRLYREDRRNSSLKSKEHFRDQVMKVHNPQGRKSIQTYASLAKSIGVSSSIWYNRKQQLLGR